VQLPRYAQELADAAKLPRVPGEPNLYEQAVKKWQAQVDKLGQGASRSAGEFTLRSSTQQLIRDLRGATPEQVDAAVNRWILDKARYQARVVARNEAVEAYRDEALAGWAEQEWVVGVRWSLSGAHPRMDICDVLANQDLYGLGPGGYPVDEVPERHPSCLCILSAIADGEHFNRELAKARGEAEPPKAWESGQRVTGDQWLRGLSAHERIAVAGPTRAKLVMQGRSVMSGPSKFAPVYELLGQAKPEPRRVMVAAERLVAGDRARMVQPFPDLPGARKSKRPSQRPTEPAPKPKPKAARAKPAYKPLAYGEGAPELGRLRAETKAQADNAQAAMRWDMDRYVGDVPAEMTSWIQGLRQTVADRLGLKPTRTLDAVEALLLKHDPSNLSGGHMAWDGTLRIKFRAALDHEDLLDVVVHEAIHTMGGTAAKAYRGTASVLEEIATEELTRSFKGTTWTAARGARVDLSDVDAAVSAWEAFPADYFDDGHAYNRYRRRLMSVVEAATGEKTEAVVTRARDALARWKRKSYDSEAEATEAFIDALQPNSENQRAFYRKTLLIPKKDWDQ
jgi:hypothetical protein